MSEDPSLRIIVDEIGKYSCQRADSIGKWKTIAHEYSRTELDKKVMRIHGIDVSYLPITHEDQRDKIIELAHQSNDHIIRARNSLQAVRKKLTYTERDEALSSISHFLEGNQDALEEIKQLLFEIDNNLTTRRPQ